MKNTQIKVLFYGLHEDLETNTKPIAKSRENTIAERLLVFKLIAQQWLV